jgi:hypothetical protein
MLSLRLVNQGKMTPGLSARRLSFLLVYEKNWR